MPTPDTLLLGPVLGYEWDAAAQQPYYTIIVRAAPGTALTWEVDGVAYPMVAISKPLKDKSVVWRAELALPVAALGPVANYTVKRGKIALKNVCGDSKWSFHLPAQSSVGDRPRIAFCSCNGVTDSNTMRGLNPLQMWERMEANHRNAPYTLLLMGGDQLYCDDLARKEGTFARVLRWIEGDKPKTKPTPNEFLDEYFDHYLTAWVRIPQGADVYPHAAMIRMMASIPSVMMWDDHDIFDGWGSYQASDRKLPYFKEAFEAARAAFEIYQIRGEKSNRSLLDRAAARPRHYSQALSFAGYHILVLDNRTNRTPNQIMDETQWNQITSWLDSATPVPVAGAKNTLLVVSPVPVVYRRFYDWVSDAPGEHGGEDDLRDHWSHRQHEGEREKLVYHLFKVLKYPGNAGKYDRVTLLSGDVHVGSLGFLERTDASAEIGQIVSSGIVHPPPNLVLWEGLKAISSDADHSIKSQPVIAKMTRPVGAKDRYLRCRNFAWLKDGTDGKLWVNWECENLDGKTPERVEFGLR